jgi:YfiH family protein
LVFSDQVHDDKIKIVDYTDIGKGIEKQSDIKNIDALITNLPGVPLITFYADCVPLFFLDPDNKVVALAHAGWKGTMHKIGAKTILRMKEVFGTNPSRCLVGIGPSIEKSCFEVGNEVFEQFEGAYKDTASFCELKDNSKYIIDLWEANKLSLIEVGVEVDNITISGMCTKCHSNLFFSHRRQGSQRGSLSAIIELRDA